MDQINRLIIRTARAGLAFQQPDGSYPGGVNGPYQQRETPVRNTSGWTITLCKAYEITEEAQFKKAASGALAFLISSKFRPHGKTYINRLDESSPDASNGLVGQAWAIDALAIGGRLLGNADALAVADEVMLSHPQDPRTGLWRSIEPNGLVGSIHGAINQQIWMAAAAVQLNNSEVRQRVESFLKALPSHMRIRRSGIVQHRIQLMTRRNRVKAQLYRLIHPLKSTRVALDWHRRSVGYHSFVLAGLAQLHSHLGDHAAWASCNLTRILRPVHSRSYLKAISENPYAFNYNPTGFEIAMALLEFQKASHELAMPWIRLQLARAYDLEAGLMRVSHADPVTLQARFSQLCKLHPQGWSRQEL